jgi:hypothetical protein
MPRQNFLSRDSFVDATEKQTKETILSIPDTLPGIRYIGENRLNESIRFSYLSSIKQLEYHIDISVLPLNEKYTRISLHASHKNGQAFHSDAGMAVALHDFESAILAALKGELNDYKPYEPKVAPTQKLKQFFTSMKAQVASFSLKKRLSRQEH